MRGREVFLDRLRVIATCAVVLLHTVSGVIDTMGLEWFSLEKRVFVTVRDLVCWCVPVFVVISGYLFLNPKRELSFRVMLTKYCRRILLALFLFGVPYACLEQAALEQNFRLGMLGQGFLLVLRGKSWAHMWYLYLILLLYLLTPALKWILARISVPAVYALLIGLAVGGSILPFLVRFFGWTHLKTLPDDSIYFFYYLCGYLFALRGNAKRSGEVSCAEAEEAGRERKKGKQLVTWLLPTAVFLILLGMIISRFFENYTVQMAYNYPFTVALALLLFGWGLTWDADGNGKLARAVGETGELTFQKEKRSASDFWREAASLTFAVYLIHPVFLNVAYKFFHVTPLDFNLIVSLPLFFLGTLALAFGTAWLLRKIPVLRKYVL